MRNYGLYIEFKTGVFTLVGGLKSVGFNASKNPDQAPDFTRDHRILTEGSGVAEFSINGSLTFINQDLKEMRKRLFEAWKSSSFLKCYITIPKDYNRAYQGTFVLNTYSGVYPDKAQSTEQIGLISSGEVSQIDWPVS